MSQLPAMLNNLLSASGTLVEDAWAAFVSEYSGLLLHVARQTSHGRDDTMDAYAYLLEQLKANQCKRLRSYAVSPNSKFTTWLVVVARRICVDHNRSRYGRVRNLDSDCERERLKIRRSLEDLAYRLEDSDEIVDENGDRADHSLEAAELSAELQRALASFPPRDQLLVRLRFEDDLSAASICEIMKFPSQFHVYRRLNVVLAALRESLRAHGIETAAS